MRRLTVAAAALLLLAAGALGGWLALASNASASADVWHSPSAHAWAHFTTADPVYPCVRVETDVLAMNWVEHSPPAKPVQGTVLIVVVEVWDDCEDMQIKLYFGWTHMADVQVRAGTGSASGIVPVCNPDGTDCHDLDVSLDWKNGGSTRDVTFLKIHLPACKVHEISGSRPATASGTIVVNDRGINLTPDPAVAARLNASQSGSVCKV